jgi:hypothetical protein
MKAAPEKVAPKTKATPKNRDGGGAKDKGPSLLGRVAAVGPVSAVPAAANDAATATNDAAAADDDGNDRGDHSARTNGRRRHPTTKRRAPSSP